MSDTPPPDPIPGRGSIVSLGAEIDALRARLSQAEQERDAYKRAKAENDERAEVVALRTALEPLRRAWEMTGPRPDIHYAARVSLIRGWPTLTNAIIAALGSTNEPEETRGEADDVGRRPPTTTPNPSHLEARGGRPWDIFKREAQ